jgi:hypothetical protein
MNDRDRLERLRELVSRLQCMPASTQRDWMLAEVRARVVDVEPASAPTPMRRLPQDEPVTEIAAERSRAGETVSGASTRRKRPLLVSSPRDRFGPVCPYRRSASAWTRRSWTCSTWTP